MATNFDSAQVAGGDDVLASQYNDLRGDVLKNAGDFEVAAGAANVITLAIDAQITAYEAGQVFKFKASAENTGAVTLNVNGLGARDIVKNDESPLLAGDILTDSIVVVVYNGTNFRLISGDGNRNNIHTFLAGETIAANEAVSVSAGSIEVLEATFGAADGTYDIPSTSDWIAQTFLTSADAVSIPKVTVVLRNNSGAGTPEFRIAIYETAAGKPTGSALGSQTQTVPPSTTATYTITFPTPVAVSPSTTYAIVVSVNVFGLDPQIRYVTAGGYANGAVYYSADSGATWGAAQVEDLDFDVYEIQTKEGYVYLSNATNNDELANNFVGFCINAANAEDNAYVVIGGVKDGFSALTTGDKYYLSDTAGEIANAAGTQSRPIGIAISSTEILIKNDNI